MNNLSEQPLLTVKQVAQMLNIAKSSVYGYACSGQLKPIYLPRIRQSEAFTKNKRAIRFTVEEVNKFYDTIRSY